MGNPSGEVAYALQLHFLLKDSSKHLLEHSFFCDVVENPTKKTGISELRNFLRRSPPGRPTPVGGQRQWAQPSDIYIKEDRRTHQARLSAHIAIVPLLVLQTKRREPSRRELLIASKKPTPTLKHLEKTGSVFRRLQCGREIAYLAPLCRNFRLRSLCDSQ